MQPRAVIFDMDGVLIDSEPLWRRAEIRCFGEVGLALTEDDCRQTMGRRIDEVVGHWYERRPWPDPHHGALVERIVDAVVALVEAEGEPMAGVHGAVDLVAGLGLPLAVASSSPRRLIDATLRRLGIADAFAVVHSAEDESLGKPHPGVYLTTAARLGVPAAGCVAIEDSVNGLRSAQAAGMRCLVVPEAPDPCFATADAELSSLAALTPGLLLGR